MQRARVLRRAMRAWEAIVLLMVYRQFRPADVMTHTHIMAFRRIRRTYTVNATIQQLR